MRIDIELPRGSKAELAKRLFAHVEGRGTDLAPDVLEIDQYEYRDPELARRERREIFGRFPFMVPHGTELAHPGDFLRTQLPNNEALLARQSDGSVQAFVNVCRHRGARLVEEGSGSRRQFSYRLADTLCYRAGGFDEPINWKVLMDAFLDAYHIATRHAGSVARYFHSNIQCFDQVGRHGRAVTPRRSIGRILHEPPETAPIQDHVTVGYSFMPNAVILRQPDHFQLLTFLPHPSGPGRCRMEIRLIIPEPAGTDEQRALWDKDWEILMAVLRDEDMGINRDLQMALGSEDSPRTLLVGRNEVVNQRFHAWLDEVLPRQGGTD